MTTITTDIEITPSMMAKEFWAMGSDEQIEFFSELAKETKKTKGAYSLGKLQWCFMSEDMQKPENKEAKEMLMTMASFLYWHTLNYKETV